MSQPFNQPIPPSQAHQPGMPHKMQPQTDTNGLGLAGFIISIASLALCGTTSIIGLIVSAIGLTRQPKGFATAGVIIGFVGLLELAGAVGLFLVVKQAATTIGEGIGQIGTQVVLRAAASEIAEEWQASGELPSREDGQSKLGNLNDAYGNPIVYETDGNSFSIRSRGPDDTLNTADDMTVGPFTTAEDAIGFSDDFDIDSLEGLEDLEGLEGIEGMEDLDASLKKQIEALKQEAEKSN